MGFTVRQAAEAFAVLGDVLSKCNMPKESCDDCESPKEEKLRSLDL
jgi:hypothetical protein